MGSAEREVGAGQGWNLMMAWMKFIVLDTWRKGRLKLEHRSHIGFIAAPIFEPQRASWSGGLSIFSIKDFDALTACEGFATRFLVEFPFFKSRGRKGRRRLLFLISTGGVGL